MKEKQEHMTPALLKTGIPLAISLAGFFISVMIRRTRRTMPPNTQENQENGPLQITNLQQESSSESLDSTTLSSQEEQLARTQKEKEAEILGNREEMKQRMQEIEELDAEVMELRRMVDQLQQEKEELMEQIELRENSATPTLKMMADDPNQQRNEYEELLTELEQVQNDKAADIDELIYLRWINACLRYNLMRNQEQQESEKHELGQQSAAEFSGNEETNNGEDGYESENLEGTEPEHTTFMDVETTRRTSKRKPMLFGKLRRWVKGKESQKKKMEKKSQEKSSGRFSASEMASEDLGRRNSCSALKPRSSVETAP